MRPGYYDFRELVTGKKSFRVPDYQRNYSWETKHLDDLWRDLENVKKNHFYGTIILEKTEEDEVLEIVDGQQRLTSALILLNELARNLQKEDPVKAEEIRRYYILDPSRSFKLVLMGADGGFFKDYLHTDLEDNVDVVLSKLEPESPSQKRLRNAVLYFSRQLDEKKKEISEGKSEFESFSQYCRNLHGTIESLDLMVYPVESRTRAVQVFSITNDRGKGLTNLEKTKSFLMEQLFLFETKEKLEEMLDFVQRKFQQMYEWVDRINDDEFSSNIEEDQIQRFHFILWDEEWTGSYGKRYYQSYLKEVKKRFREMEKNEKNVIAKKVVEYTEDLWCSFQAMYRLMLRKRENTKIDRQIEERLERLLAIGRLGNFYPLLITSYRKYEEGEFNKKEFCRILERIETFIFRVYSVMQKPANTARIPFYKLARKLHKNGIGPQATLVEIGAETILSEIGKETHERCNDDALKEILKKKNLFDYYGSARKNELRYLLYFYEKSLEDEGYEGLSPPLLLFVKNLWQNKPSGEIVTIEHVWPQNDALLNLNKEEKKLHAEYKHRLGNLAYMTGPWNSSQQNQPVIKKLGAYKKSKIRMLNEIAEIVEREGWKKDQIEERGEKMISKILEIWPDPKSN